MDQGGMYGVRGVKRLFIAGINLYLWSCKAMIGVVAGCGILQASGIVSSCMRRMFFFIMLRGLDEGSYWCLLGLVAGLLP